MTRMLILTAHDVAGKYGASRYISLHYTIRQTYLIYLQRPTTIHRTRAGNPMFLQTSHSAIPHTKTRVIRPKILMARMNTRTPTLTLLKMITILEPANGTNSNTNGTYIKMKTLRVTHTQCKEETRHVWIHGDVTPSGTGMIVPNPAMRDSSPDFPSCQLKSDL